MSTDSSQTADSHAMTKQVEAVCQEFTGLQQALARARVYRLALLLVAVVLVGAIVWVFYGFGKQFTEKAFADRLAAVAQERLEKNSVLYTRELHALVDGTGPKVADAFTEQVKKDMPKYFEGMEKERDQLAAALVDQLGRRVENHYAELLVRNEKLIQDEFPAAKDPQRRERLVKNMDRAMQKLVKKYYLDEMEGQFRQLFATWDAFPPAPAPRPGDPSTEDQLIPELLDLLKYNLSHSPEVAQK
jgi:hypothetical protein